MAELIATVTLPTILTLMMRASQGLSQLMDSLDRPLDNVLRAHWSELHPMHLSRVSGANQILALLWQQHMQCEFVWGAGARSDASSVAQFPITTSTLRHALQRAVFDYDWTPTILIDTIDGQTLHGRAEILGVSCLCTMDLDALKVHCDRSSLFFNILSTGNLAALAGQRAPPKNSAQEPGSGRSDRSRSPHRENQFADSTVRPQLRGFPISRNDDEVVHSPPIESPDDDDKSEAPATS